MLLIMFEIYRFYCYCLFSISRRFNLDFCVLMPSCRAGIYFSQMRKVNKRIQTKRIPPRSAAMQEFLIK